jgi:tight adherence protein B
MVTAAPFAILLGACAAVAFALFALWSTIRAKAERHVAGLRVLLERSGLYRAQYDYAGMWLLASAGLWLLLVLLFHPAPIAAALYLPFSVALTALLGVGYLRMAAKRRTERFVDQLELAMRLMASGLRAGLGVRQGLALVVEEMPNPARDEFARMIGQTTIGLSIFDALDDLAARIPRSECLMMARVMRIQSRTGGDLGRLLEDLANTVKERRRMTRKISALTSEGRASAVVLGALPVFVGTVICMTQHDMAQALLFTPIGHVTLAICTILEMLGVLTLVKMLKVNVS